MELDLKHLTHIVRPRRRVSVPADPQNLADESLKVLTPNPIGASVWEALAHQAHESAEQMVDRENRAENGCLVAHHPRKITLTEDDRSVGVEEPLCVLCGDKGRTCATVLPGSLVLARTSARTVPVFRLSPLNDSH